MAKGTVAKFVIVGNLVADPETRFTSSGSQVATFRVATITKAGDQERVDYHRVTCFGKLAEIAGQYLKKGQKVYVEGRIAQESWEKDGVRQYGTAFYAQDLTMLGGGNGKSASSPAAAAPQPEQPGLLDLEDIPF